MERVPREAFLEPALAEFAYEDTPLPIDANQTISQPYIVALMTEALALGPDDRVLEVGTGSGYAAAVLAEIAGEVYTDRAPRGARAQSRAERLARSAIANVHGAPRATARSAGPSTPRTTPSSSRRGVRRCPTALLEQLAPGGRLVIPVGEGRGRAALVR